MPTRGKIEDIAEKAGQVMGGGTEGAVFVRVGANNAEKAGMSAIVGKYRRLVKKLRDTDWTDCVVWNITSNGRQG